MSMSNIQKASIVKTPEDNKNIIVIDTETECKNFNGVVIGEPGAGMSYSRKTMKLDSKGNAYINPFSPERNGN